jgi:hypothetical protein
VDFLEIIAKLNLRNLKIKKFRYSFYILLITLLACKYETNKKLFSKSWAKHLDRFLK